MIEHLFKNAPDAGWKYELQGDHLWASLGANFLRRASRRPFAPQLRPTASIEIENQHSADGDQMADPANGANQIRVDQPRTSRSNVWELRLLS
jgi:hypothetical protein